MVLRRRIVLSVCFVALVLSFSFVTIVLAESSVPHLPLIQDTHGSNRLFFSTTFLLGTGLHDNSVLNQPTRIDIYNFVKTNPGVHFRGICHGLGLPVGVVQYHLDILSRAGLLSVCTDGQYKRYFEFGAFSEREQNLISLLRHDKPRRILTVLSQNGPTLHKDLTHELSVSSQALSWQMNQLKSLSLVDAVKEGMSKRYLLNRENTNNISLLLTLVDKGT